MQEPEPTLPPSIRSERTSSEAPGSDSDAWHALLRRWFIEYNPLYLASAMLVLAGAILISRAVTQESLQFGGIAVGAVAEIYAFALIGGAAFLTRIGQQRPAALLALLAGLYQCDLTLQVETYAYYGTLGELASSAWLVVFVAKLYALTRALRLRLSYAAFCAPVLGAVGLAVTPHLAHTLDVQTRTALISLWIFALGAASLWTSLELSADFELDVRARRAIKGTWLLWASAVLVHVLFWVVELDLEWVGLLPPLLLLSSRWVRRESALWVGVVSTLLLVALVSPSYLSMTALMAGGALALRALRRPIQATIVERPVEHETPYRTPGAASVLEAPPPLPTVSFQQETDACALGRLLVGVLTCNYLCLWSFGWAGGAAPEHILSLDLIFVLLSLALFCGARARLAVLPVVVTFTHLGVQLGWIITPRGSLQLGATAVGLGFAVLFGSIATSWYLGRLTPARTPPRS